MVAVFRGFNGAGAFRLADSGMAVQASRRARRFCPGFDILSSQAVLDHQFANLVDRDLRFPGNKRVGLRLKFLKLCLDLL
jgi:hypothetical protein